MVSKLCAESPSLTLAHGRADLSGDFRVVKNTGPGLDAPACAEWLAVLPTCFVTLRNWGLSLEVLIADEAHDLGEPYIAHELATRLRLHAMQVRSAILLTATLPLGLRSRMSRALAEGAVRASTPDDDPTYPSLSMLAAMQSAALPREQARATRPSSVLRSAMLSCIWC